MARTARHHGPLHTGQPSGCKHDCEGEHIAHGAARQKNKQHDADDHGRKHEKPTPIIGPQVFYLSLEVIELVHGVPDTRTLAAIKPRRHALAAARRAPSVHHAYVDSDSRPFPSPPSEDRLRRVAVAWIVLCVFLAIAVVVFLILAVRWLYDDAMGPDASFVFNWIATLTDSSAHRRPRDAFRVAVSWRPCEHRGSEHRMVGEQTSGSAGGSGIAARLSERNVMATDEGLRYIDSDGHILEHPTAMPEYGPRSTRPDLARRDRRGWSGVAAVQQPPDTCQHHVRGGRRGHERRGPGARVPGRDALHRDAPAAWNAKARLQDMDQDHIDLAVLYPTMLLGLQSETDVDFAEARRAPTTTGAPTTCRRVKAACSARARCRRCTTDDVAGVAAEIRRVAELPGMVSVFMRPNPAVDWRPFNDPVYDPIWQAASETGLPIALHPFLAPDLPGACMGLRLARPRNPDGSYADDFDPNRGSSPDEQLAHPEQRPSTLFTQAIRTRSTS